MPGDWGLLARWRPPIRDIFAHQDWNLSLAAIRVVENITAQLIAGARGGRQNSCVQKMKTPALLLDSNSKDMAGIGQAVRAERADLDQTAHIKLDSVELL
jgi:hypothetical protein